MSSVRRSLERKIVRKFLTIVKFPHPGRALSNAFRLNKKGELLSTLGITKKEVKKARKTKKVKEDGKN